ncbi:signal peptide prediction [Caenimonas soli]|uniref:signal peptide prediction n=1 Tax=Caenimonas soli TaxID=2735555 RepID=UPI001552273B|nr:signal peptide prediction [Caenimonas soli]NPC54513.1 signal peptide prediction [Caenimonas soli]
MIALRWAVRGAAYAWASPYTVVGLVLGLLVILFGGGARLRQGALEFGGGKVGEYLSRLRPPFAFSAITLGHVVLGLDHAVLGAVRAHEQVHVRQYERWGPLFVPAYLLSSLVELLRGRRPYLDNWFEREAYGKTARGTGAKPR